MSNSRKGMSTVPPYKPRHNSVGIDAGLPVEEGLEQKNKKEK
jgi:hypothetical protein